MKAGAVWALLAALTVAGACSRPMVREPGSVEQQTGATTSLGSEPSSGPLTVDELLRGRVAGLQIVALPGGGYSYSIRNMEAGVQPLFLVDGIEIPPQQLESALSGLTRTDIRKVEVFKDLASTAMYGVRGSGGVVIISTKKR